MAPSPLDRATLHTWRHHWQDEYDAAYLYLALAGQEPAQQRKEGYIKLAGVEQRHVPLWAQLLAAHAETLAHLAGRAPEPWHKTGSGRFLRNVVYGFNDGLTANYGLVAGVIGASVAPHVVLVSGVAGMFADALSMGASGYLAAKSEQEVYDHEIAMEKEEIRIMPEVEEEELALVYQTKGIEAGIARQLAAEVMRDSQRALDEQVREELKIGEAHSTPFKEGWLTGASTAVGALIPVAPFLLFSGPAAAWIAFTIAMLPLWGGRRAEVFHGARRAPERD